MVQKHIKLNKVYPIEQLKATLTIKLQQITRRFQLPWIRYFSSFKRKDASHYLIQTPDIPDGPRLTFLEAQNLQATCVMISLRKLINVCD